MAELLAIVSIAYVGLLFAIAKWGDSKARDEVSLARHPAVYALALGIYCTSWTYFGVVGAAAQNGWAYLPIYIGPILLLTLGYPMLKKLMTVSKKHNITSIADFVACRYGKRQMTALVVTLLMTLAVVPYIALQLKAINSIFAYLTQLDDVGSWSSIVKGLVASLLVAVFVILFGVKKADVTEYRSGLMLTIAAESIIKLIGLLISAIIAVWILFSSPVSEPTLSQSLQLWSGANWYSFDFIVQTLMAAAAFLCLPRQFHVMVVDNAKLSDLNTARWLSPLYLVLMAILIVPIAMVGSHLFHSQGVNPDTLTMQLPMEINSPVAVILVFIGGLSAATAMVIVATLTLGTMWANEVVMPLMLKREGKHLVNQKQYHKRILTIRRASITAILALAFIYYQFLTERFALHGIGLIAFSLVIQILPAIIGGLYWRKGHATGVYAGLVAGFTCWLMFLLMPLAMSDESAVSSIVSRGVVISLSANFVTYIVFSLLASERLIDKIQASSFVHPNRNIEHRFKRIADLKAQNSDIKDLMGTFLGEQRCQNLLAEYQQSQNIKLELNSLVTADFVDYCERHLAGVLGASSARSMINIVVSGKQLDLGEVVNFFDDTTKALQANQSILFNSLEALSQGISVVDRDLKMVAWNKAYLDLFNYPEGKVQVGLPVAELIRYNADRGECGQGTIDELIDKRLTHMRNGTPHNFIRRRTDGRIIEMVGHPLPNGGYVTSFTDITRHIEAQKALRDANIDLEESVQHQISKISEISAELNQAKQIAEQANATKTRFLALASHDILQPLNAARLYLSSLEESDLNASQVNVVHRVESALQASEELISTLLEISRLEQGALQPTFSHFYVSDILNPLIDAFAHQCQQKDLVFSQKWQDAVVRSDPTYLRRIVQNLLSNAVKYTQAGKVQLTVRPLGDRLRIQIRDTGAGVSEAEQTRIFTDFYRAHPEMSSGAGLGLAVVMRMSEQLNAPISLDSTPEIGSCFSVAVPLGEASRVINKQETVVEQSDSFERLSVLCVDDNQDNLDALTALLSKWHCQVVCHNSIAAAIEYAEQNPAPSVMLVDYQLAAESPDGLGLIALLRQHWQSDIPASLVTAVKNDEIKRLCKEYSVNYMSKPVKPARLKAWLRGV